MLALGLGIVVGFRPPESYDNFWAFQFCPARRTALNLGEDLGVSAHSTYTHSGANAVESHSDDLSNPNAGVLYSCSIFLFLISLVGLGNSRQMETFCTINYYV